MKEFVKWLGVNEKIAKIAVWMLLFMVFLILFNTLLDSLGLPFYKVTVENLSNILKRNDIKKSDAYQSGFLEGTTPTYEAYMQLKKSIAAALV